MDNCPFKNYEDHCSLLYSFGEDKECNKEICPLSKEDIKEIKNGSGLFNNKKKVSYFFNR